MKRPQGFDGSDGSDRSDGSPPRRSLLRRASRPPHSRSSGSGSGVRRPSDTAAATLKRLRKAARTRRHRERVHMRRFAPRSFRAPHTRRYLRRWFVGIAVVMGLGLFVGIAGFTPLMALRAFVVEGTPEARAAAVQAALHGQIGTPLPLVDVDAVKTTLASFSWIQSYSLRSQPPHVVVVDLVERQPIGVVETSGMFELIDAAHVVVSTDTVRSPGFPLIQVDPDSSSPAFSAVAQVLVALPVEVRTHVDVITATTPDNVALQLVDVGPRIVWGSAHDSAAKAIVLATLMAAYPPDSVAQYDVSSPQSATAVPR
jgi:cell division protein FtsQ